jgi:hypothetical protein
MLARARFVLALLAVAAAGTIWLSRHADPGSLAEDPATPAFYALSLIGLCFRWFWARYLVVGFASAMLAIGISAGLWLSAAGSAALVALLVGPSMRALFEGRATPLNRWARAHPAIDRIKSLFLTQAVALGLLYAYRGQFQAPVTLGLTIALGGLGLVGLVWHRAWAVLLLLPALALEALVAIDGVGACGVPWRAPLMVWIAVAVTLFLLFPLLWRMSRFVVGMGEGCYHAARDACSPADDGGCRGDDAAGVLPDRRTG